VVFVLFEYTNCKEKERERERKLARDKSRAFSVCACALERERFLSFILSTDSRRKMEQF